MLKHVITIATMLLPTTTLYTSQTKHMLPFQHLSVHRPLTVLLHCLIQGMNRVGVEIAGLVGRDENLSFHSFLLHTFRQSFGGGSHEAEVAQMSQGGVRMEWVETIGEV